MLWSKYVINYYFKASNRTPKGAEFLILTNSTLSTMLAIIHAFSNLFWYDWFYKIRKCLAATLQTLFKKILWKTSMTKMRIVTQIWRARNFPSKLKLKAAFIWIWEFLYIFWYNQPPTDKKKITLVQSDLPYFCKK